MNRNRFLVRLAGFLAVDAAVNAVAFYELAPSTRWGRWSTKWANEDLDRLGFPRRLRRVLPIIKSSAAAGLLLGIAWPKLGKLTARALVAYFFIALGFHVRAKDPVSKTAPAIAMLGWSAMAEVVLRGG